MCHSNVRPEEEGIKTEHVDPILRAFHSNVRPEEEGIKTCNFSRVLRENHSNVRPEEEGIKTQGSCLVSAPEWIQTSALKKKGLRRLDGARERPDVVIQTSALKKKGLRLLFGDLDPDIFRFKRPP